MMEEQPKNWSIYVDEENKRISNIPNNDIAEHQLFNCHCEPEIEVIKGFELVVHNSFDGREALEEANRILNEQEKEPEPEQDFDRGYFYGVLIAIVIFEATFVYCHWDNVEGMILNLLTIQIGIMYLLLWIDDYERKKALA